MEVAHVVCGHDYQLRTYWDSFIEYVKKEINLLHQANIDCHLDYPVLSTFIVHCHHYPEHLTIADVKQLCRKAVSMAVAKFMMEVLEEPLIRQILEQDYHYDDQQELQRIYEYCYQMLWLSDEAWESFVEDESKVKERREYIFYRANDCLQEESILHLDGFIRFRLKNYLHDLQQVAEFAIDEYVLDKEYDEFIRLMRYFASLQPSSIPFLHIFHTAGDQFQLLDEKGRYLRREDIRQHTDMWLSEMDQEDGLVMSTLLTMSPQKMILHTEDPQVTVVQTLQHVFEERLTLCTGCKQCRKWRKHQDFLSFS